MTETYDHPAFPQPDNLEISLWRYLDFDKFDWLLASNRLFMPSADRLGDPHEGTQPTGDLKWWKQLAANAETDEKRQIVEHNHKLVLRFSNAFRLNYYVSCWHINSSESEKMWRCYTKNCEAVAIRTTYRELRAALPTYVNIGMVRYIDYATERLPSLNLFEYITHKNANFRFECEVRAVAFPPATEQHGSNHFQENIFELEALPGFRFFAPQIETNRLVQRVVLHPKATSEFEERIQELCTRNGLVCPTRSNVQGLYEK